MKTSAFLGVVAGLGIRAGKSLHNDALCKPEAGNPEGVGSPPQVEAREKESDRGSSDNAGIIGKRAEGAPQAQV